MAYDKNVHGVVNVAKVNGTDSAIDLYSGVLYNVGDDKTQLTCDNGTLVTFGSVKKLDTLSDPDGIEVYKVYLVNTANIERNLMGIVASPEIIPDESQHYDLENFYNGAGEVMRIYALTPNSLFTMTAECFDIENVNQLSTNAYVIFEREKFKPVASFPQAKHDAGLVYGKIEKVLEYDSQTQYLVRIY